jgi:dihydrofolate reductase
MVRSLIVAMSRNRVIGHENDMPWRLPADIAHFKRVTMGHPVIMGRKTFESIGKALPGRLNIVVTRTPGWSAPGCKAVGSLDAAFGAAGPADEVFVIGGGELYAQALPGADRIYLTEVDAILEGDTLFPVLDASQWVETELGRQPRDGRHAHALRFVRLDRCG